MGARKPEFAVPVTIAKWWKDRRHTESVHVTLSEYQGCDLISIRVYATGKDGIDRPTAKGISMAVSKLPKLCKALCAAEAKAIDLGIIDSGSAE